MQNEVIVIYTGSSQYDSLKIFSDELGYEFSVSGYEIVYVDLSNINDINEKFYYLLEKNIKGFFSFNGIDTLLKESILSAYNVFNSKHYHFYVDHPMYHSPRIKSSTADNNIAFFADINHVAYNKRMYGDNYKHTYHIPLGGIKHEDLQNISTRKKTIVFFSSYTSPNKILNDIDSIENKSIKFIIKNLIDIMISSNIDITDALDTLLKELNLQLSDSEYEEILNLSRYADMYVRNYTKHIVIDTLINNEITVDIYGNGWDTFKCSEKSKKYINVCGCVDYLKSVEIMEEYKFVLNVMPFFKKGSHDRIFNAMLAGGICLTDSSQYLDTEFEHYKNVIFYDMNKLEQLPLMLKELQNNEKLMTQIASNGLSQCENRHLWKHRAQQILAIMNENQ